MRNFGGWKMTDERWIISFWNNDQWDIFAETCSYDSAMDIIIKAKKFARDGVQFDVREVKRFKLKELEK